MSNIDTKHVMLGAVAAAVILNACDWVINNYILDDFWRHLAQTRNVDMFKMNGTSVLVTTIVVDCLLGLVVAWLYAAVRPRLGRGPGTAIIVAFVVCGIANAQLATFGGWFVTWDVFVRTAALSLVAMLAASLAAGWVYKEAGDVD